MDRAQWVRWLFLRLLATIYLIAFASLYPQIPGLIGVEGVLPAGSFLHTVHEHLGARGYYVVPTLAWLRPTGGFLQLLAGTGIVFSLLAMAGIATGFSFLILWLLYLSLVSVGQDFLAFQWDILLLETGFLTIFFAPWQWAREKRFESGACKAKALALDGAPDTIVLWLLRWLLFRLTFLSGVVKLQSHDRTWRNLTALDYHFETQPLPNVVAWYVHQFPGWFHKLSVVAMFGMELLVPFLIFAPRRLRYAGAFAMIGFQLLILLTGNYTFFNLLTIALCVLLFGEGGGRKSYVGAALTIVLVPASLLEMAARFDVNLPGFAEGIIQAEAPFHLVNSYGLFAVMTTSRPEIIIEGSDDGETWRAYEFPYKPGDLRRAPPWVAPHQPRLDWQMWFAALGSYQNNPWFTGLVTRILAGSPAVIGLLKANPFPGRSPRYLRALVYDYHFTTAAERAKSGNWWKREPLGVYFPPVSLKGN